jgi:transposase-like protein
MKFIERLHLLFLSRKKEIFDSFRIVDKVAERNISCPSCMSSKTIKNGIRKRKNGYAIHMECQDCKRGFTL